MFYKERTLLASKNQFQFSPYLCISVLIQCSKHTDREERKGEKYRVPQGNVAKRGNRMGVIKSGLLGI